MPDKRLWKRPARYADRRRWKLARLACFERDGWRCRECGRAGRLEAHHVKPLHKGGAVYDLGNLKTLCRSCHAEWHRQDRLSAERLAWRKLLTELLA